MRHVIGGRAARGVIVDPEKVRIVGEKASNEWWDERPNQLSYEVQGEPARILERGMGYLYPEARSTSASAAAIQKASLRPGQTSTGASDSPLTRSTVFL